MMITFRIELREKRVCGVVSVDGITDIPEGGGSIHGIANAKVNHLCGRIYILFSTKWAKSKMSKLSLTKRLPL